MQSIFFVPGIEGSKLSLNANEIWPPGIEDLCGYTKTRKLLDPNVVPTGIIDYVLCEVIYQKTVSDLTSICTYLKANKEVFYYDWRLDLRKSADMLASAIGVAFKNGSSDNVLVCHSMGGLVGRYLIESGTYAKEPWFGTIKKFIGLCVPNLGAPVALAEALGLEGSNTISASDTVLLTSHQRYPAAYQCLPAPGVTVLQDSSGTTLDIYDATIGKNYGLDQTNIAVAKATFDELNLMEGSKRVEYHLIAGSGHTTEISYSGQPSGVSTVSNDAGDGTVPLYSSTSPYIDSFVTPGDHVGVLGTWPFRSRLYDLLGAPIGLEYAEAKLAPITISLNKRVYAPREEISVLIIPEEPTSAISGSLKVQRTSGQAAAVAAVYPVAYSGQPSGYLKTMIAAPSQPGGYRLIFEGDAHATVVQNGNVSSAFAVSRGARAAALRPPGAPRSP